MGYINSRKMTKNTSSNMRSKICCPILFFPTAKKDSAYRLQVISAEHGTMKRKIFSCIQQFCSKAEFSIWISLQIYGRNISHARRITVTNFGQSCFLQCSLKLKQQHEAKNQILSDFLFPKINALTSAVKGATSTSPKLPTSVLTTSEAT